PGGRRAAPPGRGGGGGPGGRVGPPASGAERLAGRDFAELSPDELAELAALMRRLTLATPVRPARRFRSGPRGHRIDLRTTLRQAGRTAGDPVRLARRERRGRPRRLVVLCGLSGSLEPDARARPPPPYRAASPR